MKVKELVQEILDSNNYEYHSEDCGCCGYRTYEENDVKLMIEEAIKRINEVEE